VSGAAAGPEAFPFAALLERLLGGADLSRAEARAAMEAIVSGALPPVRTAALLVALRAKRESPDEVAGMAEALRARCAGVALEDADAIDTCGTGGDGAGTFNVSTAAALVAAGAGARVAKHGNRAISSRCGSADVLEALGVKIEAPRARLARSVAEAGFGFLFAPAHHAALRHAAPVRRELGVRTVLNILGPLANPAGVARQVVGVFEPRLVALVCGALGRLGARAALVVHGADGLDEVTTTGPTRVARLARRDLPPRGEEAAGEGREGGAGFEVVEEEWRPRETFGLEPAAPEALRGGDAVENARHVLAVLTGERGARRDIVLANAAAALLVAGIAADLEEGVARAAESIDSGRAMCVLERARRIAAEPDGEAAEGAPRAAGPLASVQGGRAP
jgi:anthranilate phosphoribosyltransferase